MCEGYPYYRKFEKIFELFPQYNQVYTTPKSRILICIRIIIYTVLVTAAIGKQYYSIAGNCLFIYYWFIIKREDRRIENFRHQTIEDNAWSSFYWSDSKNTWILVFVGINVFKSKYLVIPLCIKVGSLLLIFALKLFDFSIILEFSSN